MTRLEEALRAQLERQAVDPGNELPALQHIVDTAVFVGHAAAGSLDPVAFEEQADDANARRGQPGAGVEHVRGDGLAVAGHRILRR